jgi:hypothetical protein
MQFSVNELLIYQDFSKNVSSWSHPIEIRKGKIYGYRFMGHNFRTQKDKTDLKTVLERQSQH